MHILQTAIDACRQQKPKSDQDTPVVPEQFRSLTARSPAIKARSRIEAQHQHACYTATRVAFGADETRLAIPGSTSA